MSKLDNVLGWAQRTPWAILPTQGEVIAQILARRAAGGRLTEKQIRALIEDRREVVEAHEKLAAEMSGTSGGIVAVIPVVGTIMHRAGGMDDVSGIASTQRLVRRVREAQSNPSVKSILLDIDSPGGSVDGVAEAAAELREGTKPVVAVANTLAASAAYWLAAQADELIVTPSGEVGSIGVYSMHADMSGALEKEGVKVSVARAGKFKAERLPFAPLSDEARAEMDAEVADYYELFVRDVAKGRGTTPGAVRNGYGEGRTVRAKAAVDLGMADKVATLEETFMRLSGGGRVKRRAMAEVIESTPIRVYVEGDTRISVFSESSDPAPVVVETATVNDADDIDLRERELDLR